LPAAEKAAAEKGSGELSEKESGELSEKELQRSIASLEAAAETEKEAAEKGISLLTCFTGTKVQILTPEELEFGRSISLLTCFTGTKVQILTPEELEFERSIEALESRKDVRSLVRGMQVGMRTYPDLS